MLEKNQLIHFYNNETLEDLQRAGFRMIQPRNGFRFGEDSVLLAAIAAKLYSKRKFIQAADLGAGCGAVSLLLAARLPQIKIWSLELDSHRADCLHRNIRLNKLCDRMTAVKIDLKEISNREVKASAWKEPIKPSSCDLVLANPPYRKTSARSLEKWNTGTAEDKRRLLAVEEVELSIDQLAAAAARLLKPGGSFVVVHRPHRLPELLTAMLNYRLEPVSLQVIESLPGRPPSRIIAVARYQGKSGGFKWLEPLRVCNQPGNYTDDAKMLYGHEPQLAPAELFLDTLRTDTDWIDQTIG